MFNKQSLGIAAAGLLVILIAAFFIISPFQENGNEGPSQSNKDQEEEQKEEKKTALEDRIGDQGKIQKFENREEVKTFLQENETVSSGYSGRSGRAMPTTMERDVMTSQPMRETQDMAMEAAPSQQTKSTGDQSRDHSKTNIQVEGVDEADVVKNDGEYIYALSKKSLYIIRSYPAQDSEIVSQIKFDSQPQNIYLNQDKLAIFGSNNNIYQKEGIPDMEERGDFTFFKVFDISDKSEPEQVRDLNFEGDYFDSRMVGDHVYFVTSNPRYRYLEDAPALPRILEDEKIITDNDCRGDRCVDPEVYRFDIPYDSYDFTNVAAINIQEKEEEVSSEMYLFSGNQNMYVSPENIYITYTKRINPRQITTDIALEVAKPMLDPEEKKKINDIQQAESYILSEEEKSQKIERLMEKHFSQLSEDKKEEQQDKIETEVKERWEEIREKLEKTIIHKIAIDGNELEYQTQGEVTGHVLNQFSMSEQGDHFRIATTKNRDWGNVPIDSEDRESYSNIYVLNSNLEVVGGVEELAPGERIYSARFMQDRGYLVTFETMDPLFVVDLTDPRDPEVLGKLKIPGFSNYLHPYDDETLIGIGKDTKATEWGVDEKGLKISLFDVSDVNNPEQVDTQVLGKEGSDSIALNDHKAVLFDKEKNLLSIPVKLRSTSTTPIEIEEEPEESPTASREIIRPPRRRYSYFRGAAVLDVNSEELELRGKIQHNDGNDRSDQIKRSLYIEDTLYTLSDNYLKMNELLDLDPIKELRLEMDEEGDHQVIN